jgi:hypothetical protein
MFVSAVGAAAPAIEGRSADMLGVMIFPLFFELTSFSLVDSSASHSTHSAMHSPIHLLRVGLVICDVKRYSFVGTRISSTPCCLLLFSNNMLTSKSELMCCANLSFLHHLKEQLYGHLLHTFSDMQ